MFLNPGLNYSERNKGVGQNDQRIADLRGMGLSVLCVQDNMLCVHDAPSNSILLLEARWQIVSNPSAAAAKEQVHSSLCDRFSAGATNDFEGGQSVVPPFRLQAASVPGSGGPCFSQEQGGAAFLAEMDISGSLLGSEGPGDASDVSMLNSTGTGTQQKSLNSSGHSGQSFYSAVGGSAGGGAGGGAGAHADAALRTLDLMLASTKDPFSHSSVSAGSSSGAGGGNKGRSRTFGARSSALSILAEPPARATSESVARAASPVAMLLGLATPTGAGRDSVQSGPMHPSSLGGVLDAGGEAAAAALHLQNVLGVHPSLGPWEAERMHAAGAAGAASAAGTTTTGKCCDHRKCCNEGRRLGEWWHWGAQ